MEDEDIVEENPLMEETTSLSFCVKDVESSNPVNELQLNQLEEAGTFAKDINIMEEHNPTSSITIDLTKEFETNMEFESREAVVQWCQEVGRKNKTVIVISKTSNRRAIKGSIVELQCERGGSYHSHAKKDDQLNVTESKKKRKRDTSKKCGCPFKLRSICREINKWTLKVIRGTHNHVLPTTLTGHAYAGRLKKDEEELVVTLISGGCLPGQVLEALKQNNKENHSTIKTIYNARAKLRRYEYDMKEISPMTQLINFVTKHHYVEYNRRDPESDEITDIFWTHPEAAMLAQCFPSVLIIDCTFKTNQFNMPLFHVMGMTSTGKYFTVAFAFLHSETEEHYTWALTHLKTIYRPNHLPSVFVTDKELALLNGIHVVFPEADTILCTSHIDKNIHDNCRKSFDNEETWERFFSDWKTLQSAETANVYGDTITKFVSTWATTHGSCISYICEIWFDQKERFVNAWTSKIKHYGNTSTDRAERERSKVNSWLIYRNSLICWEGMHKMFQNEHVEIEASFQLSLTHVKQDHQILILRELWKHVSQEAIDRIMEEMKRNDVVGMNEASCRCILRNTHGLPCAHELVQFSQEKAIPLSAIDQQWKQLSLTSLEKRVGFDLLPELQKVRQRWIEASEMERKSVVERLKKVGVPKETRLVEY